MFPSCRSGAWCRAADAAAVTDVRQARRRRGRRRRRSSPGTWAGTGALREAESVPGRTARLGGRGLRPEAVSWWTGMKCTEVPTPRSASRVGDRVPRRCRTAAAIRTWYRCQACDAVRPAAPAGRARARPPAPRRSGRRAAAPALLPLGKRGQLRAADAPPAGRSGSPSGRRSATSYRQEPPGRYRRQASRLMPCSRARPHRGRRAPRRRCRPRRPRRSAGSWSRRS